MKMHATNIAFLLTICVSTLIQPGAAAFTYLAGYEPLTNVVEHSEIDLDAKAIMATGSASLTTKDTGGTDINTNYGDGLGETCGAACLVGATCVTADAASGVGCGFGVVDSSEAMPFPCTGDFSTGAAGKPGAVGHAVNVVAVSPCIGPSLAYASNVLAYDIWKGGKNSATRSLAGFSYGAATKSSGNGDSTDVDYKDNKHIAIMNAYWKFKGLNEFTWGYDMIKAAFDGVTIGDLNFATVGRDFRQEAIQKGMLYLNLYPYVIWEMQDQINDCNAGSKTANDDNSVHAWDEAVAFWAGSEVGTENPTSSDGTLLYALAEKRATNFKTFDEAVGSSVVASEILKLFTSGKTYARSCTPATSGNPSNDMVQLDQHMDKIATHMLTTFVQGVMRYLYKTKDTASAKEAGELWAFATVMLPFIHHVNPTAAELLYQRAWKLDFSTNTYEEIKSAVEGTYGGLGAGAGVGLVNCEAVGDLYDGELLSSKGTCYSSTDDELPKWLIAVIFFIVLSFVILVGTVVFFAMKKESIQKSYDQLLISKGGNMRPVSV
jgi:Notch-like protein